MTSPVVRLNSVVALVDRYPVLAGVDFEVSTGEIVALTGPNGAGKTSLIRLVAGLIAVHQGTAEVLGNDLASDRRGVRSRIGLIGHDPFLYDELTVRENAVFFARSNDVDSAISQVGLSDRAGVLAGRLSSGQRRRLALAILIARKAELWLLDEPHAGLDAQFRDALIHVVRRASADGTTVIFSSHDPVFVSELAHRSVVVDGGVVKELADVR